MADLCEDKRANEVNLMRTFSCEEYTFRFDGCQNADSFVSFERSMRRSFIMSPSIIYGYFFIYFFFHADCRSVCIVRTTVASGTRE